ncbi:MAG TPA: hypothetical protein VKC60_04410 [Opitutaceae bacterium]|nr:hypothetical protein [Opitutaceae bacterium]
MSFQSIQKDAAIETHSNGGLALFCDGLSLIEIFPLLAIAVAGHVGPPRSSVASSPASSSSEKNRYRYAKEANMAERSVFAPTEGLDQKRNCGSKTKRFYDHPGVLF